MQVFVMLLKGQHVMSRDKKKVICPIVFDEFAVTGGKFVAMIEDTALFYVLA
jgi:hypothetical protein